MSVVEYKELENPEGLKYAFSLKDYYKEGFIKLGKVNGVYPKTFLKYYERIKNFKIKEDDIWVVTFPKSGTTWTQEMVWCIMNDLDFKKGQLDLFLRFPYFEMTATRNVDVSVYKQNFFDVVENMKSPRFVKTHLHFFHLPTQLIEGSTNAKMIYVSRNPKDVFVSYYHHARHVTGYQGTLEDLVEQFITDNVFYAPYWTHLREFFEVKERDDILFLEYEEMKKDLPAVIRKTAKFLDKSLTSEQIQTLAKHLSFESMKNNQAVNYSWVFEKLKLEHGQPHDHTFMRKGQVGSWKEELSPELVAKLDKWIKNNQTQ